MAKRYTCEGIARYGVLGINGLFFALGLTVLILACLGFSYFSSDTSSESSVVASFQLPAFSIILLVTGSVTVALSLVGSVAAYRYQLQLLKLYLLCLLAVICIQVAMGVYLLTLSMGTVSDSWNQETSAAQQTRVNVQLSLQCCGFDTWTDSIGYLHTACPFQPSQPVSSTADYTPPQTCQTAIRDYVNRWLVPVAVAAIVLAVVELVAVATTSFIIFRAKDRQHKTGFEY